MEKAVSMWRVCNVSFIICSLFKVLFSGERQTAVHIMGKEDAGQAGEVAGQTIFPAT